MLTAQAANRKDLNAGPAKMEHRHFATIAAIIRELPADQGKGYVATLFASRLKATNPNFNRQRFLAACLAD